MSLAKGLMGSAVAAGALWLGWALFVEPAPPAAPPQSFASSRECQSCHVEPYAEWEASWHAQSWTDTEVRMLSNDFANTDCIDCHAPRPVFETGLGQRVLPRAARRVEGVDCLTCHQLPDGTIAGTIDNAAAACRPVARRELVQPELCAPCHDQHLTVQQWKATPFAQPGPGFKSCIDCHMPFRGGDPTRGRDHTMHGGHDLELVRSAVELRARRAEGKVLVEVENVAAGHNFPTDERSRAADIFWRPLATQGSEPQPWRHLYRFRNPYRYEVGIPNTELPFGQTAAAEIAGEGAEGALEVALFYKLSPYWKVPEQPDPDTEAKLVHRLEVAP
jgi:hypothetical protein